jgi:hypothetical protein
MSEKKNVGKIEKDVGKIKKKCRKKKMLEFFWKNESILVRKVGEFSD